MADGTEPIPSPPGLPILGNLTSLNPEGPIQSMAQLADQYGPIFQLKMLGRTVTVVSSNALVNEVCDETRFKKTIGSALNVRLAPCSSRDDQISSS